MSKITPISPLRKKVKALKKAFDEDLEKIFKSEMKYILKLQKDQLWKGERGDGKRIVPEYAETTIKIKKSKGQPTNRVTLRDTGEFYSEMDVDYSSKDFLIVNYDEKFNKLEKKYTSEILGLNSESQDLLRERVKTKIEKRILKNLSKFI